MQAGRQTDRQRGRGRQTDRQRGRGRQVCRHKDRDEAKYIIVTQVDTAACN